MKQNKVRNWGVVLAATALATVGLTGLGSEASAETWHEVTTNKLFTNKFDVGQVVTRIGPGTFVGGQFNNAVGFNGEDKITIPARGGRDAREDFPYHVYATTTAEVTDVQDPNAPAGLADSIGGLNTGSSSGLFWKNSTGYGNQGPQTEGAIRNAKNANQFFTMTNEHWAYADDDTYYPGNVKFRYTAKVAKKLDNNSASQTYTFDYEVITTITDDGKVYHEATLTNTTTDGSGTGVSIPAGEDVVMEMDSALDGNDDVPVYQSGVKKSGYMYKTQADHITPIEPKLKLTMTGEDLTVPTHEMWLGLWGSWDNTAIYDDRDVNGVNAVWPSTAPYNDAKKHRVKMESGLTPGAEIFVARANPLKPQTFGPSSDNRNDSAAFYTFPTAGLGQGASVKIHYSEHITLAGGTSNVWDENGNQMIEVEGPSISPDLNNTVFEVNPPRVPGYTYSYAQVYTETTSGSGNYDHLESNVLYTGAHDPKESVRASRTSTDPVFGLRNGKELKVKFYYRAIKNGDANTPGEKPTTPNKPNPDKPVKPNPDNNGNTTPTLPNVVAKKGEPVYNINKIGLYKNVNFTKSNRIKSYAKRARINRYEFIVKGYGHSKTGALRYYVQQYNPYKNKYVPGTKGYITASSKYVLPVYYKTTGKTKRMKVINPRGVKAYTNKQLSNYKKLYKKGTKLRVTRVVKQKYTTRFQLSNGLYITANKKFVIATK